LALELVIILCSVTFNFGKVFDVGFGSYAANQTIPRECLQPIAEQHTSHPGINSSSALWSKAVIEVNLRANWILPILSDLETWLSQNCAM